MKKVKIFACFAIIVVLGLAISQGFGIWYFEQQHSSTNTTLDLRSDILNHNTEDADSVTSDPAKKYDVYFMAQNIDINDFIRYSNAINACEFKTDKGFEDLYYTNPEQGVSGYEPRLGSWDSNFSTDNTNLDNLFVKFSDREFLSEQDILSLGQPYSNMCDLKSFALEFLDWTLDNIYIDYPEVYYTDDTLNNPDLYAGGRTVYYPAINDATIYYRNAGFGTAYAGQRYRVYGTYPTENFNIANLNSLLENYDNYSIRLDGRDCLFFYPIYSLGKDIVAGERKNVAQTGDFKGSIKNAFELFEDCIRSEDSGQSATDRYVTYDCEYTNLMQSYKDSDNNEILKDIGPVFWTIDSGPYAGDLQGWEKYTTKYKCFRFSNREVTQEMVQKNLDAKLLSDPNAVIDTTTLNRRYPLTAQQVDQVSKGEYVFVDLMQHRKAWDGMKFSYLQEEGGELLNINYKPGLFNVYIFVKERFVDGRITNVENPNNDTYTLANFHFSQAELDGIDEIMRSRKINVDKTVSCKMYDGFIRSGGGWSKHDGRDYYVVFEEKLTLQNVSSYGTVPTAESYNFNYATHAGEAGEKCFVSNGGVNFNIDAVTGTISTTNALKDLSLNPITLTYPDYYFTNIIKNEEDVVCKQNIGRGGGQTYATPRFSYIFENGTQITKEYQSTQLLEDIWTAVTDSEVERSRISVTFDSQTYTLAELETMGEYAELYASILEQLKEVQLLKVKMSGNYRICVFTYKNGNERCFDVWASSPKGYVVAIYDKSDFANNEISKDVDGLLVSRNWMTENYSFISNTSYYDNADLLYGNDIDAQIETSFKIRSSKLVPDALDPFVNTVRDEKFVSLAKLLEYYETQGKCLYDVCSGRYITSNNVKSVPFAINKDCLLTVVAKPANMN